MRTRTLVASLLLVVAVITAIWLMRTPAEPPRRIQVRANDVVVQNQTPLAWSNIEVWVNDHYRGVVASLSPGQVLNVPLDNLVAAYGQRFDVHRQAVYGVLVTARASDGSAVRFTWGKVRRKW
jgi:hypothetical protein